MRLIVVDDDRLVVDSLKIILGAQPQIEVVGTGANGNDAVSLYSRPSESPVALALSNCSSVKPCSRQHSLGVSFRTLP